MSTINIKKAKEISQANEVNLKLQEEYANKISALTDSINKIATLTLKHGESFDFQSSLDKDLSSIEADISAIYNKLPNDLDLPDLHFSSVDRIAESINNLNFDKVPVIVLSHYKKSLSPEVVENYCKQDTTNSIKKKYGDSIYNLIKLNSEIKNEVNNLEKLMEKFDEMNKSSKGSINQNMRDAGWDHQADSILKSIQESFSLTTSTPTTQSQEAQAENKESENIGSLFLNTLSFLFSMLNLYPTNSTKEEAFSKKEEKEIKTSFSLNSKEWHKTYSKDQLESDLAEESGDVSLGSETVGQNLHAYYHSLATYGYTSAKSACFATAISNIQRISNDCAFKRTQEINNKFFSNTNKNSNQEEGKASSSAVIPSANSASEFVVGKECESKMESYYTLAENCNYIFSRATTVDESIQEALQNAAQVNVNINDEGEVLLIDSNGFKMRMTYSSMKYSSSDLAGLLAAENNNAQQNLIEDDYYL